MHSNGSKQDQMGLIGSTRPKGSCGSKWSLTGPNESKWEKMGQHWSTWVHMGLDRPMMVPNGSKMVQIGPTGSKWALTDPIWSKFVQMDSDWSKGAQRVHLGPKDPTGSKGSKLPPDFVQATYRLNAGYIQDSFGTCLMAMLDIFGQLEDILRTTLAQELDPLEKKLKQSKDILYYLRNIFLSGKYQKRHHVYHKRAQGRQHSGEVRNCCRSGLHSWYSLQI